MTQKDAAIYFGCNQPFISQMESGKDPIPKAYISKITDDKSLNPDTKKLLIDDLKKNIDEAIGIFNPERKGIPLIPVEAIAGFVGGDVPGIRIEDCDFYRVPEFEKLKADFSIRIKGDSMVPKFQNNDVIACRYIKDITFFQWGMVYLLDTCQGPLVKRIYKHDSEDFIICQSENREVYPPFDLQKTEIRSVSIVLGIIRVEMI
jgi:phage repressor protein C with HTH and peptisase S24 domain